tara:strand:- start:108508 stop:109164 length:657 start_codon:yes stop_codon:yes gene_type:complete
MKIFAFKVLLLAAVASLMGKVLSTSWITTDTVREAVVPLTSPGLLALQHGRFTQATPTRACGEPFIEPSVTVLLTADKIWIEVSYGDLWNGPYQQHPESRQWKLRNTRDGYDWAAAEEVLRDTRSIIDQRNSETTAERSPGLKLQATQAANGTLAVNEQRMQELLASLGPAQYRNIVIAAEDTVPYTTILTMMDVAVAAQFSEFSLVDPRNLSVRFRE